MAIDTSMTRISGLASGLDTDALVEQLMAAHKIPINKLNQKKQIVSWRQDFLREINTKLTQLRSAAFNMRLQSTYKAYSATSSNPNLLTVTPTANAQEGTYEVVIKQLATAATRTSTATVSPELTSSADITNFNLEGKQFTVTFANTSKTISFATGEGNYTNITEMVAGIQAKLDNAFGSNQVAVTSTGNRLTFASANSTFKQNVTLTGPEADSALTQMNFVSGQRSLISLSSQLKDLATTAGGLTFDLDDKLKFSINGESFSIDKTKTVQDLLNMVNNNTKANVKLEYVSNQDTFVLARKDTGAGKDIAFSDGAGSNLFSLLSLGAQVNGQNAIYDYTKNGVTYSNMESSTNSFNLEGNLYTFVKADPATPVTFSVSKDVDKVMEGIKEFVKVYNETLDIMNNKLSEKRYRSYEPLSDEQKKEMSEKDIELWESKAKSGLLAGDRQLQGIVDSLRRTMYEVVPGVNANFDHLSEIGIETGSYSEKGKLYIDEQKLRDALTTNMSDVANLFTNTEETGITQKLYEQIKDKIDQVTDRAGTTTNLVDNSILGKEVDGIEDEIARLTDKLFDYENRYYKQFTGLETALNRMNQQSAWLMSQFNGGG